MKILFYSPLFYPLVGGLETVVSILAHEFCYQGHDVKLVSLTPATDSKVFPFEVLRQPNPRQFWQMLRWCDVYFQPNISLKGIWPLVMSPKPWVISHNSWYTRSDGSLGWQDYLKHFLIRFARGISVSQAVAAHISTPSQIIANPYREDIFYEIPKINREKELVFVGRLVSDKGVDLLLEALANLKTLGVTPTLTVVGTGPEEHNLRQQVKELSIGNQVDFVGMKLEQELAQILNAHKILVVPSRWDEPFGIVALEGIACGCVVVGSDGGGLKDAIDLCGITFPNGNVKALTKLLYDLLTNPDQLTIYKIPAKMHLSRHKPDEIAKAYLKVMEEAIK